jgi:hypothetical protein
VPGLISARPRSRPRTHEYGVAVQSRMEVCIAPDLFWLFRLRASQEADDGLSQSSIRAL